MPEGDPDILRATPRGKILSAALILLGLAVLTFFQMCLLPSLQSVLRSSLEPNAIASLKLMFAGFTALAILPSVAMIIIGKKILKSGQCPPPNAWLWRDTRIKRGRNAVRLAWLSIVSGTLAGLVCAILAAYVWIMFDRIIPQYPLRPGVTILLEKSASTP